MVRGSSWRWRPASLAALVCDSGSDPATAADAIRAARRAGSRRSSGPPPASWPDAFEAAARPTGTLLEPRRRPRLDHPGGRRPLWRTAPSDARQATAMARLLAAEALADVPSCSSPARTRSVPAWRTPSRPPTARAGAGKTA
ncbi:MAG: hypothetical protein R3F43_14615 [bacterium]